MLKKENAYNFYVVLHNEPDKTHKFASSIYILRMIRLIKHYTAKEEDDFNESLASALGMIQKENPNHHAIKLTIYIKSNTKEEFQEKSNTTHLVGKAFYKDKVPALSIIPIYLQENKPFVIESILHSKEDGVVNFKQLFDHHYTTVESLNSTELFSASIIFNESNEIYNIQKTLDFAEQILDAEEMTFEHLYKQNNYIGKLSTERLDTFNEIKDLYYGGVQFHNGLPLNINIGVNHDILTVDICALYYGDENTAFRRIKNSIILNNSYPQIDTIQYSPKGDINQQTTDTILNIIEDVKALQANLNPHLQTKDLSEEDLQFLRVTVKEKSDLDTVGKYISESLPSVPFTITCANLAQDNQLIQIEGITNLDITL